ncbi:cytochrome c oxidase subunit II [Chamaesiphon sp. VAR_48_metabat_403]|uniref:cytochrome c oxidase subunit II n=1 Tax=Chamaesiphon sp. VAR_48_metabat_403 TaxID=2964700 RepID=UPI00286E297F|nr:cytochrome c oxidase subunit II [Chamaesiphon sp. VAR_48_metabat_403]
MNIPSSIITLLLGIGLTLVSLWYGQNHGLMPVAASEEATHIDGLFNAMMTISVGLFLLVQGVLVVSAIKFRRKPGELGDGAAIEGNVPLEILWTAIPAAIVLWISIYSFEIYNEMGGFDPATANDIHAMHGAPSGKGSAMAATMDGISPKPNSQMALGVGASPANQGKAAGVSVNVLGLQYAWIFTYPDANVTSGELHIPVGKEVQLNMNAQDVIHAVWIPELRLKQDVIPGTPTQLRFTSNKVGNYPLRCAELCGGYHGSMVTRMIVHTPEDYDAWIASQQQATQAQAEVVKQTIAMNPANLSPSKYLAPYAKEMGIKPEMVSHLHHEHQMVMSIAPALK